MLRDRVAAVIGRTRHNEVRYHPLPLKLSCFAGLDGSVNIVVYKKSTEGGSADGDHAVARVGTGLRLAPPIIFVDDNAPRLLLRQIDMSKQGSRSNSPKNTGAYDAPSVPTMTS